MKYPFSILEFINIIFTVQIEKLSNPFSLVLFCFVFLGGGGGSGG